MIERTSNTVSWLEFDSFSTHRDLVHAVTLRPRNYAPHRGPNQDQAVRWRKELCEKLNVPFARLTAPSQVHGGDVLEVWDEDIGRGREGRDGAVPWVDGLITDRADVPMLHLSADCPIICVFDPDRPAVGAVHASWRGTMAQAAGNLVAQMNRVYGSKADRLLAAIGPSAGPDRYEVGRDVYRIGQTRLPDPDACLKQHGDRWLLNLWEANRQQLVQAGVPDSQIEIAGICSMSDERFWSHRRDGSETGRFAVLLALRG